MTFNKILVMQKITLNNANSYIKARFLQHFNDSILMLIIHCYWYKTVTCLNFKRDVNQICFYNLIFIIHCECIQNNNITALLFKEGKYVLRHILLYICVFVVNNFVVRNWSYWGKTICESAKKIDNKICRFSSQDLNSHIIMLRR